MIYILEKTSLGNLCLEVAKQIPSDHILNEGELGQFVNGTKIYVVPIGDHLNVDVSQIIRTYISKRHFQYDFLLVCERPDDKLPYPSASSYSPELTVDLNIYLIFDEYENKLGH